MRGIKTLERKITALLPRPLILLCRTPDGQEKEMTTWECVQAGSSFVHVVRGNNLDDFDNLLTYVLETQRKPAILKEKRGSHLVPVEEKSDG